MNAMKWKIRYYKRKASHLEGTSTTESETQRGKRMC